MFCTKCGRTLNDGEVCNCRSEKSKASEKSAGDYTFTIDVDKVKENVGKAVKDVGAAAKDTNASIFERDKKIVPECISANEGEVPIKQYNFARLQSLFSLSFDECRLQITNKRLLLRATGKSIIGKIVLQEEFMIDEISGLEIKKRPRFSFGHLLIMVLASCLGSIGFGIGNFLGGSRAFGLIIAIIACLGGIAGYIATETLIKNLKTYKNFYMIKQIVISNVAGLIYGCLFRYSTETLAIIVAPIVILWIINGLHLIFAPSLTTIIKTKGGSPALELKRKELGFLLMTQQENSGFSQVMPWKDTDLVIEEIGTILDDLHTMGDIAIEKWKKI